MVLIENIHRLSNLLPVLFFLMQKNASEKAKRVILYFCLFIIIHGIIYTLTKYRAPEFALYFNHLFIPIEFFAISYYFHFSFGNMLHKRIVLVTGLLFYSCWLFYTLNNPEEAFDSTVNGIESLIAISYSILYFYEQLRYPKTLFIYMQPSFWGVAGFFLFFTGSFFVFIYRQTSETVGNFLLQYVYIHAIFYMLRNILFSIGMVMKSEKSTLPDFT